MRRWIELPMDYRTQEMTECYLKGVLKGYGIGRTETHSNMTENDGGKHLLTKKVKHLDKTIGEILGRKGE